MRAILSAISLVIIGLGLLGWGGWNYIAGTTGEKTTAVVDQCTKSYGRKGRSNTTCYGTWQSNGVPQRGQIEGVGEPDEGTTVEVRIHDGEAYAFSWVGVLIPAAVGGFMLIASVFWAAAAVKGTKKQPQGYPQQAYPPPGYPQPAPYGAQPPYPQQSYAPPGYPPAPRPPAQYPPAQYPRAPYPQAPYPQAPYPQAQYPQAPYPQAQYPQAQYPRAPHPPAQYPPPGYPQR